jgi:ligand-binding sensor domain-containing protein/two-component sensor histidine kinase
MLTQATRILLIFLCTELLVFQESLCYGQSSSYAFRHITRENGLASNNVLAITQDHQGYIWIGTDNGLQKFDGYDFTNFRHIPGDTTRLMFDYIDRLWEDSAKKIWTPNEIFDPATARCTNPRLTIIPSSSLKQQEQGVFIHDNLGRIWFSSDGFLALYNYSKKKFIPCANMMPLPEVCTFRCIYADTASKKIWLSGTAHIVCYDQVQHRYCSHLDKGEHHRIFSEAPNYFFNDKRNNIWAIPWWGNINKYDSEGNLIKSYTFKKVFLAKKKERPTVAFLVTASLVDSRGNIWLYESLRNEFLYYDGVKDTFLIINSNPKQQSGLHFDKAINCLFEDKDGYIWIGTDEGINIFNPYVSTFKNISLNFLQREPATPVNVMNATQASNGDIWMATWRSGLVVLDSNFNFKANFLSDKNNKYAFGDSNDEAWTVFKDGDGKILVGSHGLISTYDYSERKFFNVWPAPLNHKTVMKFSPDKTGNTWLRIWGGDVMEWTPATNQFRRFSCPNPYFNKDSSIQDIFIDSKNNLWLCIRENGIFKVNTISGNCEAHLLHRDSDTRSISGNTCNSMTQINDSLMAFGEESAGIDIFNVNRDVVEKKYNTTNGLAQEDIRALYFQPPEFLWAALPNSICKINIRTGQVANFAEEDGISNANFDVANGFYKLRDGRLLATHDDGFFCFDPLMNNDQRIPDDPLITGFSVYDRQLNIDSMLERSDTIRLSYKQNFFTIRFASINYINPDRISYYYQLKNVDKNWLHAVGENTAQYTDLPGGKYVFQVKSENSDGKYSPHITSLVIIIDPPFWRTYWFYCLIAIGIIATLYLFYRYRINQLHALQAVRNKISRDLHDDLGATLSSISVLSEVIKNKSNFDPDDENYSILTKINNYSREMVDSMRDIVWAINPTNDNMGTVVQRLRNFAAETCSSKEIRVHFNVQQSVENLPIPMNTRKNVFLICKEAIHNAARHSACSAIAVSISSFQSELSIEIGDDGNGFSGKEQITGNGLVNMSERAKEIKAHLTIQSGPTGTKVRLLASVPRFRD